MLLDGKSVLIVEDEFLIAEMLADMLGGIGCTAAERASNVAAALKALEKPVDVAFLDLDLDGQSSAPIAEALDAKEVPFIISTGYGPDDVDDRWKGRPLVQKPFLREDVEAALRQALGQ
jgi:CheY-like chemotaxis protein